MGIAPLWRRPKLPKWTTVELAPPRQPFWNWQTILAAYKATYRTISCTCQVSLMQALTCIDNSYGLCRPGCFASRCRVSASIIERNPFFVFGVSTPCRRTWVSTFKSSMQANFPLTSVRWLQLVAMSASPILSRTGHKAPWSLMYLLGHYRFTARHGFSILLIHLVFVARLFQIKCLRPR